VGDSLALKEALLQTSHRTLTALFSLCLLALALAGCGGQSSSEPATSSLPTAALQSMLSTKVAGSTSVPGAVLAVSRRGEQWIGVAGEADTGTHAAMDPSLRFRVGSLTKQFTAALVLKLAEEGRLSLDDTLRQWLPGLGFLYDDRITIRMLLNHTSGVPSYTTASFWNDLIFSNPTRTWQPIEMVQLAKAETSVEPGTVYSYCNTGYILAGMIAEAAAGESVSAAMARRFFVPLGMHNTELATDGTLTGNHAHGYLKLPGSQSVDDVSAWDPSSAWTAGSVISTAHDMLLWADALFGGRVLSASSLNAMLTPMPPSTEYGLGFELTEMSDGRTFVYHSGLIPGYYSLIAHHRESDLTILILTNREDISQETNDIVGPIFDEAVRLLQ
jgi:D-alanyl-D-alanine carboxypeptidase